MNHDDRQRDRCAISQFAHRNAVTCDFARPGGDTQKRHWLESPYISVHPMRVAEPDASLHSQLVVIDALQAGGEWRRDIVRDVFDGGLTAVHVAPLVWEDSAAAIADLAHWQRRFRTYPEMIMPGLCADDILTAKRLGRTAIIYGAQNASVFDDDLDLVWVLYRLGMRIVQL